MALPAGISTFTLTYGQAFDYLGGLISTSIRITPSHELIWAATGDRLVAMTLRQTATGGEFGQIVLPHPHQDGFVDVKGNTITDFWYTVDSTDKSGSEIVGLVSTRRVQPTVDQILVDLDLIPVDQQVRPPGTVPAPAVTSVNGETGAVTVAEPDVSALIPLEQKGAASGVAELDAASLVPVARIPLDDIAASTQVSSAFVRFTDQNGYPLPAGSVTTIVINTANGEIDDIIFEGA